MVSYTQKGIYKVELYLCVFLSFILSLSCYYYSSMMTEQAIHNSQIKLENKLWNIRTNPERKQFFFSPPLIRTIQAECKQFPIATDMLSRVQFDDTWGAARSQNSMAGTQVSRVHEGCDIIDSKNTRGEIPICSMTDGIVEQLGWLTLGGYRIGIRSANGIYYYYAHLHSYANGLQVGSRINAGQFLGFMGDTGYGKKGTKGKFVVHLHIGIYMNLTNHNYVRFYQSQLNKQLFPFNQKQAAYDASELSINPYSILKQLYGNK